MFNIDCSVRRMQHNVSFQFSLFVFLILCFDVTCMLREPLVSHLCPVSLEFFWQLISVIEPSNLTVLSVS